MDETSLDALAAGKYLLVTSYRRNGTPVATPVWVVRDRAALGVWTAADSYKVRRIRNRPDVLVGPCDVRGRPTGRQVPGRAEATGPDTTERYRGLIARKYGIAGRLTLLGSRLRRGKQGTTGLRITLTD